MRADSRELFRHVSAEKATLYRGIMDVFAAAKRQYRLPLRPDEVLAEAQRPDAPPRIEEVNAALTQLASWGNLESQPDTARLRLQDSLANNDGHGFFERLSDSVITGPTLTNANDFRAIRLEAECPEKTPRQR